MIPTNKLEYKKVDYNAQGKLGMVNGNKMQSPDQIKNLILPLT
jgi:hypothetical protein